MFGNQVIFKLIVGIFILNLSKKHIVVSATYNHNPARPLIRLSSPSKPIYGQHISTDFYAAAANAEKSKENLQGLLQNFIENVERNLTTSSVLKTDISTLEPDETPILLDKLINLSDYFVQVSEKAKSFALTSKRFLELTKNETSSMLLKLRQVPSAHYFLQRDVKVHLTNYFTEMESLYVTLSEVLDDGMDFITSTLQKTGRNFNEFASLQKYALEYFKPSVSCCKRYMDYVQQLLPDIFKCAAGQELHTAYDIYAITTLTSKYILGQLEFRIGKLFNCFAFDNYTLRCRFLRNAEEDFKILFEKVDELNIFYDIRMRKGQISKIPLGTYYSAEQIRQKSISNYAGNDFGSTFLKKECLPNDFTENVTSNDLKPCFRFSI